MAANEVVLPETGFLRLKQVLALMGFQKTKWYAGIEAGEFPRPIHHGRAALYRAEDIRALIEKIGRSNG